MEMNIIITKLLDYGILGVAVIRLAYWVDHLMKEAKVERKEWQAIAEKSTDAHTKNTEVLSALKTMLETRGGDG